MNKNEVSLRSLLVIALPMIVSQASETIMMFADRLFLAGLGKEFIAAAMSGGLTSFTAMSLFGGIVGYSNALSAQYFGAGKSDNCSKAAGQAGLLSFIFYPLLFVSLPAVSWFFHKVGHTPEQINLEYSYFRIMVFGSIFFLLRNSLTGFFLGIGKTKIVMFANLAGMAVNIPANYILIYGKFGMPALGIRGAAIGTVLGGIVIFGIQLLFFFSRPYRIEFKTSEIFEFRFDLFRKLLRFGAPAGLETFLNVGAFNFFVQLMHSYSTDVAAAVTITFNYDMVAFVPMIGLGFATTAIAGQQVGAGNISGARYGVRLAYRVGLLYALIMMMVFVAGAGMLVKVFTSGIPNASGSIEPLAVVLLRMASLYTIGDVTQLVYAGALRGAGDTGFVMRTSVIMHWILATVSFVLIKLMEVSPVTMWIILIMFVLCTGTIMFLRFKSTKWEQIKVI